MEIAKVKLCDLENRVQRKNLNNKLSFQKNSLLLLPDVPEK